MKISLCQIDLMWENPKGNFRRLESLLSNLNRQIDLLILPEMFTSGFTMSPELVAPYHEQTLEFLNEFSKQFGVCIMGSWIIGEENNYYNRMHLIRPEGYTTDTEYYDKHRLFKMAKEHLNYSAGTNLPIWDISGWSVLPQICYDLRFPELPRSVDSFDILVYVASWPQKRIEAWDTLLKARSIENQAYCIGVNRIGIDGYNLPYVGHSACYGPLGEEIIFCDDQEGIFTFDINQDYLLNVRKNLPFLQDRVTITLS